MLEGPLNEKSIQNTYLRCYIAQVSWLPRLKGLKNALNDRLGKVNRTLDTTKKGGQVGASI